jgi:hypothetical protein
MMHTKRGVFAWAVVLLTAVATATPAIAKGKPGGGGAPVFNDGRTCMESADQFSALEWDADTDEFVEFTLTPKDSVICIDVTSGTSADYLVEVTDHVNLRQVLAWVKDSHPGDMCLHSTEVDVSDGLTMPDIPASDYDACGLDYTDSDEAMAFAVSASFSGNKDAAFADVKITRLPPPDEG